MEQLLKNKVFITTRPQAQNAELSDLLMQHGAQVLQMPMIRIIPCALDKAQKAIFQQLENYTWLVFTSVNGVRYFFENLKMVSLNDQLPEHIKIASVGPTTTHLIHNYGAKVTLDNTGTTGKDLLVDFKKLVTSKDKILFVEGNLARRTIRKGLEELALCHSIMVYKTIAVTDVNKAYLEAIKSQQYDAIIVTSPSGFNNLYHLLNATDKAHLKLICIGPTTAKAVKQQGIKPLATATEMSAQGIINAILKYNNIK